MKSLFVGNMSFQTSESELRELFAPFGQVTRVHMAMDRETGRARGFAFVEMPNDAEAAQAMAALDGKEVGGRNLKVNEARPKGEGGGPRGPSSFRFPWIGWTAGATALAALCCEERLMATTFQKRQKEMKRIEKRKMKEEKRAQRKLDKTTTTEVAYDPASDPTIDWNHSNEISSQE